MKKYIIYAAVAIIVLYLLSYLIIKGVLTVPTRGSGLVYLILFLMLAAIAAVMKQFGLLMRD